MTFIFGHKGKHILDISKINALEKRYTHHIISVRK